MIQSDKNIWVKALFFYMINICVWKETSNKKSIPMKKMKKIVLAMAAASVVGLQHKQRVPCVYSTC